MILQPDTAMILGILLILLALPSWLSALADSRRPVLAVLLILSGGALAWWSSTKLPGGFDPAALPDMLLEVIARVIN